MEASLIQEFCRQNRSSLSARGEEAPLPSSCPRVCSITFVQVFIVQR